MNMDLIETSVQDVQRAFSGTRPQAAIVLGSGWNMAITQGRQRGILDYRDIPCLGAPQTEGHQGQLVWQEIEGHDYLIFKGRRHVYESRGWEPVLFPAYLAAKLGCRRFATTCAAGSVNPVYQPGTVLMVDDHINLMGGSPLSGAFGETLAPRFPDQSQIYASDVRQRIMHAASALKLPVCAGVYAAVPGPAYETPAEARMLHRLGADAVGMSIVPETMVANALGLRIAALALLTNNAGTATCHQDALAAVAALRPALQELLPLILTTLF